MAINNNEKRVLFITYDLSGYYESIYKELQHRYGHVDYYNTATFSFKYQNVGQRLRVFLYKVFTKTKLKNYYKYRELISKLMLKKYDITLIVRPDVLVDSQLEVLREISGKLIAYYHDSVNNIKRKKDILRFFDDIYSYEKKDAEELHLKFIPNFMYCSPAPEESTPHYDAFSVMSDDYRVNVLRNLGMALRKQDCRYKFYVKNDCNSTTCEYISYIQKRLDNDSVIENIKEAKVLVDIHKFGIQDGLTFRVFEAMAFGKKLITTNKDIKNYNFYNPDNIFVIEDTENITLPEGFLETPYEPVPEEIYNCYTVSHWVDTVMDGKGDEKGCLYRTDGKACADVQAM